MDISGECILMSSSSSSSSLVSSSMFHIPSLPYVAVTEPEARTEGMAGMAGDAGYARELAFDDCSRRIKWREVNGADRQNRTEEKGSKLSIGGRRRSREKSCWRWDRLIRWPRQVKLEMARIVEMNGNRWRRRRRFGHWQRLEAGGWAVHQMRIKQRPQSPRAPNCRLQFPQ